MKSFRILLAFFTLLLSIFGASAQIRMRQAALSTDGDSLILEYQLLNLQKDTFLNSRMLLVFENDQGTIVPVFLYNDPAFLERGRMFNISARIHLQELIDSNLSNYILSSRVLPPLSFSLYSSFGGGTKFPVKLKADRKKPSLQLMRYLGTDSLYQLKLVESFTLSPDTLQLYMVFTGPDSVRRILVKSHFDPQDTTPLLPIDAPKKFTPEDKVYYRLTLFGFPLYHSGSLTRKEATYLIRKPNVRAHQDEQSMLDSLSHIQLPKSDLSKYRLPFLRGELLSESHCQNYQNPFSLRPSHYSRLYANLRLNTPLIPLRISGFLSTENSTQTNLNSFRLTYDKEAFEEKKVLKHAQLSKKLESQIQDLEAKIKALENRSFNLVNNLESKLLSDSTVDKLKQEAITHTMNTLEDSIESKRQVLEQLEGAQDSLPTDSLRGSKAAELDSLERTYAEKRAQMDDLRHKSDSLTTVVLSTREKYDEYVGTLDKMKEHLNRLKSLRQELSRIKSPDKGLSLKHFEVGRINPYISKLTVGGVLVEGAKTELSHGSLTLKAFGGKSCAMTSTKAFVTPEELDKSFTRNVGGADLSYRVAASSQIGLTLVHAIDPPSLKSPSSMDNRAIALHGEYMPLKTLAIETELAYSETRLSNTIAENQVVWSRPGGWAGKFRGSYDLQKDMLRFFVEYQAVQTGYFSSASPFLRSNYREVKTGSVLQVLDKKVKVKLDYSLNRDNLDGMSNYTNTMKGWGITLSTAFKKYPNLMLSYQPYSNSSSYVPNPFSEQPGAVLNPYFLSTSTSLLMFNLNYSTKVEKAVLSMNSNTTSSRMVYSGEQQSQLFHSTQMLLYADKHEMSLSMNISQFPGIQGIDSMSFKTLEFLWNWQLGKVKITQGVGYFWNMNDKYLTFQKIGISTQWKSWKFEQITNIGWLNHHYFEARIPVVARVLIGYSF